MGRIYLDSFPSHILPFRMRIHVYTPEKKIFSFFFYEMTTCRKHHKLKFLYVPSQLLVFLSFIHFATLTLSPGHSVTPGGRDGEIEAIVQQQR